MTDPEKIDIEFDLHEDEEIIEVLETGEKEFPGMVLTNQRLLFAANIEDNVNDENGKADRFALKIVSSIQNRFRNGIKLERIKGIEHRGDKLIVRLKLRKFLPTSTFDIPIEDEIDKEKFLEFVSMVKNQAGI